MVTVRPTRLLAVARYEMRSHMAGNQGLRFVALALALLLPVGVFRLPFSSLAHKSAATAPSADGGGETATPAPTVRGMVPQSLTGKVVLDERAEVEVLGDSPLRLRAETLPDEVRAVLDEMPQPALVEVRHYRPPVRLPGRSLLIAILAVSLLTGPLAEALPGERAGRTLEVLLSAGISRAELIGGKWLVWTLSATATAWASAAAACANDVQLPGLWIAALPLFIASAVAFGLWLVRLADDVVGGAAAPMRVLPVVAGCMALVARGVETFSPRLAATVPLGGPLLLASDIFKDPWQLAAGAVGTAAFVTAALGVTARDLDRFDLVSGVRRHGAIGLGAVATLLWWLAVAGPAVWILAGNAQAVSAESSSLLAGGLALLGCAWIACAREGTWPWPRTTGRSVVAGVAVGLALAAAGPFAPGLEAAPAWARPLAARLAAGVTPSLEAPGAALACLLGQAWLFRFVVARRTGWLVAALLWTLAVSPFDPLAAAPAALALGVLANGAGVQSALVAQSAWTAGASFLRIAAAPALALQALAVAVALILATSRAGAPSRQ